MQNKSEMITETMMVACTDKDGQSSMYVCDVSVTTKDHNDGAHRVIAEGLAAKAGYSGPYVVFSKMEQSNIAYIVDQLPEPISVMMEEMDDLNDMEECKLAFIKIGDRGEMSIYFNGYNFTEGGVTADPVVYLEVNEGELSLYAYSDINEEEATHVINFSGAKNSALSE